MVEYVHALKGRARFSIDGLQGSELLKSFLEKKLPENSVITDASASPLTGNVLVFFDRKESISAVAAIIEANLAQFRGSREETGTERASATG